MFCRYLVKLPFIDRTRVAVFGEVRLSVCELISPLTLIFQLTEYVMCDCVNGSMAEMLNEAYFKSYYCTQHVQLF